MASPRGMDIRPTTDRVREAIFNIIGQDLSGLKVLDLFAGTGSLGVEALSRGASQVIFIDKSQHSIKLIKKNLAICGYQGSGEILKFDLKMGIPKSHPVSKRGFDLIFLDPPYGKDLITPILENISTSSIVLNGSYVIAESSKTEEVPRYIGSLEMADTRIYGDTKITIYTNEATI